VQRMKHTSSLPTSAALLTAASRLPTNACSPHRVVDCGCLRRLFQCLQMVCGRQFRLWRLVPARHLPECSRMRHCVEMGWEFEAR
jgi:hypothetical protein